MTIIHLVLLLAIFNYLLALLFKNKNNILYCGIIGFSGPSNIKFDIKKLQVLFFINSLLRGRDTVGYYTPTNGIRKIDKEYADVVEEPNNIIDTILPDNVLIGHVRAKTIGANILKNAHPWEYENIIGLHNGTLKDYIIPDYSIGKKYGISYSDYDVDSQVLLQALDKNFKTFTENLLPALEEYEGAAALLLYNKERGTVFACHDKERPLFYGYIGKSMYISSLKHPLEIIGCKNVESFEVNYMHEIKNGKIINKFAYEPQSKIVKGTNKDKSTDLASFIDEENCTTNAALASYLKYDKDLGAVVGSSIFPAKGLIYTGTHSFYSFDPLFKNFNFRMRNKGKQQVFDAQSKQMVEFDYHEDYFRIIQVDDCYNGQTAEVECINRQELFRIHTHVLDSKRFFPKVGMYVKLISDIWYTKSKTKFGSVGDILEVETFWHKTGEFTCRQLNGMKAATISPRLFVVADSNEVVCAAFDEDPLLYNLLTGQEFAVEKEQENDEPTCETKTRILLADPTEIIEEEEESLFDSQTAIIDCEKFDEFVISTKDSIDEALTLIDAGRPTKEIESELLLVKEYLDNYPFNQIIIN